MDALLGAEQKNFKIYSDIAGNECGFVSIFENGIVLKKDKVFKVPFEYVKEIIVGRAMPLGKTEACITLYDFLGDKHRVEFMVSEQDLNGLKKACGK